MRNNTILFIAWATFLASGFSMPAQAETGLASAAEDKQAKQAVPAPDSALIYIFRSEKPPIPATVPVALDGERVGQTTAGTFILLKVTPGTHYIISGDKAIASFSIECEAGKSYFISQKVVAGVLPVRTELTLTKPEQARQLIDQSQLVAAPMAAPKSTDPKPPTASVERKPTATSKSGLALILKTGRFNMTQRSQVVGGVNSEFDSKATGVFAAELEWRLHNGVALGGELYRFTNKIVVPGTALKGEMEAVVVMANVKKYFAVAQFLYPYAGAGIGINAISFSGDITGSSSGPGLQAMAGIEFRMKNIGLYTEFKALYAQAKDSADEKVKLDGKGKHFGVGISFNF